jgi:hypothetical protein
VDCARLRLPAFAGSYRRDGHPITGATISIVGIIAPAAEISSDGSAMVFWVFSPRCGRFMFTKHVRTVSDLARFRCGLKIEWGGCGKLAHHGRHRGRQRCGTKPFAQIIQRMKCSRCGAKEAQLTAA